MLLHIADDKVWNTNCAANVRNIVMTEGVNNCILCLWTKLWLYKLICCNFYCSAHCICFIIFLTGTVCSWTDCCSGNTAELYLCGSQFKSVKILAFMRFPSLHPDIRQGTADKSRLLMSKLFTSKEFNNHLTFQHCIYWSSDRTVQLIYYSNNLQVARMADRGGA
jgi:hypothetical protein